jgi:hypothetical protein
MADQSQVGTYDPRVVTMAPSLVSLRPAPQISHLAGADERDARRYQATRRRGAWWATRRELVEPTADEWAMHGAQLGVEAHRGTVGLGTRRINRRS